MEQNPLRSLSPDPQSPGCSWDVSSRVSVHNSFKSLDFNLVDQNCWNFWRAIWKLSPCSSLQVLRGAVWWLGNRAAGAQWFVFHTCSCWGCRLLPAEEKMFCSLQPGILARAGTVSFAMQSLFWCVLRHMHTDKVCALSWLPDNIAKAMENWLILLPDVWLRQCGTAWWCCSRALCRCSGRWQNLRIMLLERDLWRSLVQPPAQSRDNFQVISGCSTPCPALLKISKGGDFVKSLDNWKWAWVQWGDSPGLLW